MVKKKAKTKPSRIGSQAHKAFNSQPERNELFSTIQEEVQEESIPQPVTHEETSRGRGRPKKFDDNKMKTTVSFQREQIVWLDTVCTQILSLSGKIIDRGDIIRECLSALQESNIDLSQTQSPEEIKEIILQKLSS